MGVLYSITRSDPASPDQGGIMCDHNLHIMWRAPFDIHKDLKKCAFHECLRLSSRFSGGVAIDQGAMRLPEKLGDGSMQDAGAVRASANLQAPTVVTDPVGPQVLSWSAYRPCAAQSWLQPRASCKF